jgi:hypothetical protein
MAIPDSELSRRSMLAATGASGLVVLFGGDARGQDPGKAQDDPPAAQGDEYGRPLGPIVEVQVEGEDANPPEDARRRYWIYIVNKTTGWSVTGYRFNSGIKQRLETPIGQTCSILFTCGRCSDERRFKPLTAVDCGEPSFTLQLILADRQGTEEQKDVGMITPNCTTEGVVICVRPM